jgi:hypothetical protein
MENQECRVSLLKGQSTQIILGINMMSLDKLSLPHRPPNTVFQFSTNS